MFTKIARFFRPLTPADMAREQITDLERELFKQKACITFYEHQAQYSEKRLAELKKFLAEIDAGLSSQQPVEPTIPLEDPEASGTVRKTRASRRATVALAAA